jgi:hypothetical protein
MKQNGMKTDNKDESTRDIICMDFQFGLRSYKEELAHIKQMRKKAAGDEEKLKICDEIEEKVTQKKDLYKKLSKDDIRHIFYENGVEIIYSYHNKDGEFIIDEIIKYKMLYRNPSKAKQGSVMFIREELYDKAYEWLTMGIGKKLPEKGAKIVEISAYAPLTTSAIEGYVDIPIDDILILNDQDSYFNTIADVVRAEDYEVILKNGEKETRKKCVVYREETDVKNTIWDGMALIESSILPNWCNGMALLRNHFFKACAFKTHIQDFFKDYCNEHGINYETYEIEDMYGNKHLASSIKMITTDNATKFKKFADLMGGTFPAAYEYWCKKVKADGCIWGIVKTDHPSKLGNVQQMSYQMINTLPCTKEDILQIAQTSINYIELLKNNNDEFEKYLRKNSNAVNHYEMLADLYKHNKAFENSKMWKVDKAKIISQYLTKLRKGKITVPGDNLTVCGNPYGLLLYTVGEDYETDPTLRPDNGVIQVYTKRFNDGEFLCGIRNPHNSANNLGYYKNIIHPLMEKYFDFSKNIMAVNCIHTDIQDRLNGMDFDSDFNFVTNQPNMVEAARIAYRDFPTVVNKVGESSLSYGNSMSEYARMDSFMQNAQKAIGGSSDTAQLSQSYYWSKIANNEKDDDCQQYYENTVILAVAAQLAIDGCKRLFEVDVNSDILRIRSQPCMKKQKDYPNFMKWTHEIPFTKNGKERPHSEIEKDKNRIKRRIDPEIICPMNWLQDCLDKIQGAEKKAVIDTKEFFINMPGKAISNQMSKIRKIVEEYDAYTRHIMGIIDEEDSYELLVSKTEETINAIRKYKLSQITMNRLIGSVLGIDMGVKKQYKYKEVSKYTIKMLNMMYRVNKDYFMKCFISQ